MPCLKQRMLSVDLSILKEYMIWGALCLLLWKVSIV